MPDQDVLADKVSIMHEQPSQEAGQERTKPGTQSQRTTVEERVEQIVTEYVQCSSIQPADDELAVIREKAKVWEIWDRLRRAYQDEP